MGVNDAGQTVGTCEYFNPVDNTYDYESWVSFFGPYTFSCPTAVDTMANAINNGGEVVGSFDANSMGPTVGFVASYGNCSGNPINHPGASATVLTGVNDSGTVVGFWSAGNHPKAFLYSTATGEFTDIPLPFKSWKGMMTGQINNNGWFVGAFFDRYQRPHAFLAAPNN